MSDDGRGRAWVGVEGRKSSQKWSVRRSVVRSIAWLGLGDIQTQNLGAPVPYANG
jgi:hypothetical protein